MIRILNRLARLSVQLQVLRSRSLVVRRREIALLMGVGILMLLYLAPCFLSTLFHHHLQDPWRLYKGCPACMWQQASQNSILNPYWIQLFLIPPDLIASGLSLAKETTPIHIFLPCSHLSRSPPTVA